MPESCLEATFDGSHTLECVLDIRRAAGLAPGGWNNPEELVYSALEDLLFMPLQ